MSRESLLMSLRNHHASDPHEEAMRQSIIQFVETHEQCFERSLSIGHITASALIVNAARTKTLLTHHHKLDKWLQLGGHSDGDSDPLNVALREAEEESGMSNFRPVSSDIFDVDVHPIPARKHEPEHVHYDIRYLFETEEHQRINVSPESKDVAWIPLDDITNYTMEESILRMIRKLSTERWQPIKK